MIRSVIPSDDAGAWVRTLEDYLADNPHTEASPPEDPDLYELFWSHAQLNGRAHPNMLTVQKFLMDGCWHQSEPPSSPAGDSCARLSTSFPVTYADRLQIIRARSATTSKTRRSDVSSYVNARLDGGSEGNCEADGYGGMNGTYSKIWSGRWEEYDPWDSTARLDDMNGLCHGEDTGSVFRMFQGILPLSLEPGGRTDMRMSSLPLRLATAYWVLRPFFSPKQFMLSEELDAEEFRDPSNWTMETPQSSPLPGAATCHSQELNSILHPHLQLEKTLASLPPLNPGDYIVWHPDLIYSNSTPSCSTPKGHLHASPQTANHKISPQSRPHQSKPPASSSASTLLHIPACPLTHSNALFLARQRKAFLLGLPGPNFTFTDVGSRAEIGESCHLGRPGVQEVYETGGEEALRAMGLLAWEEQDAVDEGEKVVLELANRVLFPDRSMT